LEHEDLMDEIARNSQMQPAAHVLDVNTWSISVPERRA
jgi:hypothetical protein